MKTLLSVISLSMGLLATSAQADISVNVGAISVMPSDSSSNLNVVETVAGLPAGSTGVRVNNNTQVGLTFDYKLDKNWGVQLIAATPFTHKMTGDGAIDGLKIGKTKHLPPTLLGQYYFDLGNSNIQPFVGLGVNYTNFFNTEADEQLVSTLVALGAAGANDPVTIKLKNSWGLAVQAGMNIKLSDNLGIHFMLSKIDIDTTAHVRVNGNTVQSVDVNIDPLVAMIGLRWTL
ncbi:OmpW/AlkL family protein [Alishewanella tabrizica]|uniref:Outer membrane protein OmpW n=1 Tax=Alishewanella tabrizica TaxID=671278 RepID=A0ABQ2WIJ9_9ALTE|nr:OmpW family outer membrane protein [Alishewanella tabrizica]GGW52786.1 outer membrane protein OmpW [Alishewanella tabrizica]